MLTLLLCHPRVTPFAQTHPGRTDPGETHRSSQENPAHRGVPRAWRLPVAAACLLWSAYPQYTTSLSQPSLEYVTITHPHHPLWGQRCEVVFIRRGVDPDLILRLADGTHAAIAMSWTDAGGGQALSAAQGGSDWPLLDLQGLRQILHLLGQLRQEDRFPTPRRSTPHSRPARRKLPQGKN
jgi:hypothetical protein